LNLRLNSWPQHNPYISEHYTYQPKSLKMVTDASILKNIAKENCSDYQSFKLTSEKDLKVESNIGIGDIPDEPEGAWISFRTLWAYLGPGFLMCIAYLDPGNLEADLQTGAYTGFQLLWLLLFAHLVGLLLQCMASRLGTVTGEHLATVCRLNYPKPVGILLWLMAELAIIGSDIQEVLGSAIALNLLTGIPLWAGCIITAIDTFTFLFLSLFGVRKLEALFVFLISVMTATFCFNFAYDPPSKAEIGDGFIPYINEHTSVTALGLMGAIIMPHNLVTADSFNVHESMIFDFLYCEFSSCTALWC